MNPEKQQAIEKIRAALPGTLVQLIERTGLSKSTVEGGLSKLKRKGRMAPVVRVKATESQHACILYSLDTTAVTANDAVRLYTMGRIAQPVKEQMVPGAIARQCALQSVWGAVVDSNREHA